ncbi:MAG: class I SAM-dependent RNA methyltransferase [Clostridia bacterium]|nr:class I SAM-dependent RNA methyltransferase [Clostridia bacterium]
MSESRNVYKVTDTNSRGDGIIKKDGRVIFVPDSVEGDVCKIELIDKKKNYAVARLAELVSPSPYRVTPDCPYYETCGGCSLRHVSYEKEEEIKRKIVCSAFRRFGIDIGVERVLCPSPDNYRNKVSFKIDGPFTGFFREKTNSIVPLDGSECKTAPAVFTQTAKEIAEYLFSEGIAAEEITIRSSTDGRLSATVFVDVITDNVRDLIRFKDNVSSLTVKNKKTMESIRIFGDGGIRTDAFGLSLFVSDESFFQVNYEGASLLFGVISSIFDGIKFDLCADLFCGTGVWGLALAKRFPDKRFYGIDLNETAIRDAKNNAEYNGITNISFYRGDASLKTDEGAPDVVIVDPPRAGLRPVMINVLKTLSPKNVVYVSCDPFTLARDVEKFTEFGYAVNSVKPVNLFPRTEHVETVTLITRAG